METRIYDSILELSKEEWNLFNTGEFSFNYDFLKALELSKTENAKFKYLLFSENELPVASSILSSFILHLDLLSGDPQALRWIKTFFPKLFQVRITFCGIPASFGQNPISLVAKIGLDKVIPRIEVELDKFSKEQGSSLRAWKEFHMETEVMKGMNYHKFHSLPDCHLTINVDDYEQYRNLFNSNYKRKIFNTEEVIDKEAQIETRKFELKDVEEFHEGYLKVINRTKHKLEVYPKDFFIELAKNEKIKLKIISITRNREKISALVFSDNNALNFLLVSKSDENYSVPLYNWVLQQAVLEAILTKRKLIKLGQTSYYSKQCLGAQLVPLHIYLKHNKPIFNFLLKQIGHLLFPTPKIKELSVFKKDPLMVSMQRNVEEIAVSYA